MQKKCFVHIGMPKTGSSSIQQSLYNNLLDENFKYVDLGFPNHSLPIYSMFTTYPERYHSYVKRGINKNEINIINQQTTKKLQKNFTTNSVSNFIISGEGIIRLSIHELRKMNDFLNVYFDEIIIVGYVRSPISFIESVFQQRVKGGIGHFNLENMYPHYRRKFNKFDKVFGKAQVQLFKFDPKNFTKGNIVLDFCQHLGIKMKEENTLRVNDSLSKEAISLLYAYRKFGPEYGVGKNVIFENNKLIKELNKLGKSKFKLSPSLIKPILEKNKNDLNWIENRLGISLNDNILNTKDYIRNEEDLLSSDSNIIKELKEIIGKEYITGDIKGDTPIEMAELIHILRKKLKK